MTKCKLIRKGYSSFSLVVIVLFGTNFLCGQEAELEEELGFKSYLSFPFSNILDDRQIKSWSSFGGEYGLDYRFKNQFRVSFHTGFRRWSDRRMTAIPMGLGPAFNLYSNPKSSLLIFARPGPVALIGNDYSGIFFHWNAGGRYEYKAFDNNYLFLAVSYVQAMAFHPDDFGFIDIQFGFSF